MCACDREKERMRERECVKERVMQKTESNVSDGWIGLRRILKSKKSERWSEWVKKVMKFDIFMKLLDFDMCTTKVSTFSRKGILRNERQGLSLKTNKTEQILPNT